MRRPTGAAARDSFSAIVIIVICIIGMVQTTEFPDRAAAWPMWMWGLLGALSIVLLFNSLRQAYRPARPKAAEGGEAEPGPLSMRMGLRIAINIGLIIVFVILVPILGFFTATGLFLCVSMFYLGIRPIWKVLIVTTGTLVVFYGVFEAFLGVLVPHGLIF